MHALFELMRSSLDRSGEALEYVLEMDHRKKIGNVKSKAFYAPVWESLLWGGLGLQVSKQG